MIPAVDTFGYLIFGYLAWVIVVILAWWITREFNPLDTPPDKPP